jgi:hypothetical protein
MTITGREPALPRLWNNRRWVDRFEPQEFHRVQGTKLEMPAFTLLSSWALWLAANGATVWDTENGDYPPFDHCYSHMGYCEHTITENDIAGYVLMPHMLYPVFRVIVECRRIACQEDIPF